MFDFDEDLNEINDDYDIEQKELEREMDLRDKKTKSTEEFKSLDHDDFRERIEFSKLDDEDMAKDEETLRIANSTVYAKRMDWGINQQRMLREIKQEAEERKQKGLDY